MPDDLQELTEEQSRMMRLAIAGGVVIGRAERLSQVANVIANPRTERQKRDEWRKALQPAIAKLKEAVTDAERLASPVREVKP